MYRTRIKKLNKTLAKSYSKLKFQSKAKPQKSIILAKSYSKLKFQSKAKRQKSIILAKSYSKLKFQSRAKRQKSIILAKSYSKLKFQSKLRNLYLKTFKLNIMYQRSNFLMPNKSFNLNFFIVNLNFLILKISNLIFHLHLPLILPLPLTFKLHLFRLLTNNYLINFLINSYRLSNCLYKSNIFVINF